MKEIKQLFDDLRLKASNSNKAAIGYPVNREHALTIDYELLGINHNSMQLHI